MYVLDKKLCIADIDELTDSLTSLLEDDKELVVDANAVESVDTAALQVLVAFSTTAQGKSKSVHWLSEIGTFRESAVLAGLDSLFSFEVPTEIVEDSEASVEEDDGLCPVF